MKKKFSAVISLAAEMGSSVGTVFGGAKKEIESIGRHVAEVNKKQREIHKANKSALKVSGLEKQLKEEMGSLVRTRKAIDQKTGATKKQAAAEKRQKDAIDRTRQALLRQREELKKVERGLQSAGVDTRHLSREMDRLGSSAARSGLRLEQLQRRAARMGRLRSFGRGVGRYMGGIGAGFGASMRNFRSLIPRPITSLLVGGGLMGLGSLGAKSFLDSGIEQENFQTQMRTMEKRNPENVKKITKWIEDFAWTTPFEISDISEAFSRTKLSNIDPMKGNFFRNMGDAAASRGKTMEEVARAVQGAMVGEFGMLKDYGITTSRNAKDGTVTFRAIDLQTGKAHHATAGMKDGKAIQAILSGVFMRNFSGSMQEKSETTEGLISGAFEMWKNFQKEVMAKGVLKRLKDQLSGLLDTVKGFRDDGTFDKWAQIVADRFGDAIDFTVAKGKELFAWTKEKWDAGEIQNFFGEVKKVSGEVLAFGKAAWGVIEPLGGVKAIMVGMVAINLAPLLSAVLSLGAATPHLIAFSAAAAAFHFATKRYSENKETLKEFKANPWEGWKTFQAGIGSMLLGSNLVSSSLLNQRIDDETKTRMIVAKNKRKYQIDQEGLAAPAIRGSGRSVSNSNNNNNNRYQITINAAPGQSEKSIADQVYTRLSLQQPALAGGSLYD